MKTLIYNTHLQLTAFLINETNPYPFDFRVCGSRTTLQSLEMKLKTIRFLY